MVREMVGVPLTLGVEDSRMARRASFASSTAVRRDGVSGSKEEESSSVRESAFSTSLSKYSCADMEGVLGGGVASTVDVGVGGRFGLC
jgi:hypothetical protein